MSAILSKNKGGDLSHYYPPAIDHFWWWWSPDLMEVLQVNQKQESLPQFNYRHLLENVPITVYPWRAMLGCPHGDSCAAQFTHHFQRSAGLFLSLNEALTLIFGGHEHLAVLRAYS